MFHNVVYSTRLSLNGVCTNLFPSDLAFDLTNLPKFTSVSTLLQTRKISAHPTVKLGRIEYINMIFGGWMSQMVQEVDVVTLKGWMAEGSVLLIDVRERSEYEQSSIQGARLLPTSTFDPCQVPDSNTQSVVFHCASGVRSKHAAQRWADLNKGKIAYNLTGGIKAWHKVHTG